MENIDRARAFIEHLQLRSEPIDVMQLRRSVSVARKPATILLVEEYLDSTGCKDPWERQVHYLVAALWGTMVYLGREAQQAQKPDDRRSLGHSTARLCLSSRSERRIEYAFLDLLEADAKQMPHCLEMLMVWLEGAPEIPIHWPELLADLLVWNHPDRPTQQKWARDFNGLLKERGLYSREAKADGQGEHKYKPTSVQTPFRSRWDFLSFSTYLLAFVVGLIWGVVLMAILRNTNAG